jgi:hypothetical protein
MTKELMKSKTKGHWTQCSATQVSCLQHGKLALLCGKVARHKSDPTCVSTCQTTSILEAYLQISCGSSQWMAILLIILHNTELRSQRRPHRGQLKIRLRQRAAPILQPHFGGVACSGAGCARKTSEDGRQRILILTRRSLFEPSVRVSSEAREENPQRVGTVCLS